MNVWLVTGSLGDTWSVTTGQSKVTASARGPFGGVSIDAVDLDYTPGGVTVHLSYDQAVSLAAWLALGAGYVLTPDPSGEGVTLRGER